MLFQNPVALYGLFLLLIPIIIHLFNFKRFKTVYFSNIAFLKQIAFQSKKSSQLKQLLVLISRLLFLFFVVMAFAKPSFKTTQNQANRIQSKRVVVFIDNSFSMQMKGRNGILLEEARRIASELVKSYKPTDQFKLITNDQLTLSGDYYSNDDFMSDLRNVVFDPFILPLTELLNELLPNTFSQIGKPTDVFILSDFQKSAHHLDNIKIADSSINYYFLPLRAPSARNVFMDSCWFEDPVIFSGKPVNLKYRIVSAGVSANRSVEARLFINNQQRGMAEINIEKGQLVESFVFEPDTSTHQIGYIEVEDQPMSFDNRFYFNFLIKKQFNVVLIKDVESSDFVQKFYGQDSNINLRVYRVDQLDISSFETADLIVLSSLTRLSQGAMSEISDYVSQGGKLVFIPSSSDRFAFVIQFLSSFNLPQFLNSDTSKIDLANLDLESPLFKDVFVLNENKLPDNVNLPFFRNRFRMPLAGLTYRNEMELNDNQPLLMTLAHDEGLIYLFTADLKSSKSNFGSHAIFVPVFFNMMLDKSTRYPLYFSCQNPVISVPNFLSNDDNPIHITDANNQFDFIPIQREVGSFLQLNTNFQLRKSGNYFAQNQGLTHPFSCNYNPSESLPEVWSQEEMDSLIEKKSAGNIRILDANATVFDMDSLSVDNHNELWKILLLLGILFVVIEVFLLSFLK